MGCAFWVCAWPLTQCPCPSNSCGQHWCGPALQPQFPEWHWEEQWWSHLGFMGRWPWPGGCAVGEGSVGVLMSHGHGVGPPRRAILAPPEGHPCFPMALPRDLLPCGHGADPAGAAWLWGCVLLSCWAGQSWHLAATPGPLHGCSPHPFPGSG